MTYFCVTEEGIKDLPDKDDWTQQQISNPNPENSGCQSVCQLQSVTSSLVFWLQTPLILKQRPCQQLKSRRKKLKIEES